MLIARKAIDADNHADIQDNSLVAVALMQAIDNIQLAEYPLAQNTPTIHIHVT
jgi:hypothetical protein